MTAPLNTNHRNSANITSTQLAAMLRILPCDIPRLLSCGMPYITNASGKGKLYPVGRIRDFASGPFAADMIQQMQAEYEAKRTAHLIDQRARDKAKRAARKAGR